jgi:sodium transport system ATP-binding protein
MFSSHIMQEVAALCDDIIIIAKGKICAQGSTQALLAASGKDSLEDAFVSLVGTDAAMPALDQSAP